MSYTLAEFKVWLTANPNQHGEFASWDTVLNIWGSNENGWHKVLTKAIRGNFPANSPALFVRRWLNDKDNNSPSRETVLNRWQLLQRQIATKRDNWQGRLSLWEEKERSNKECLGQVAETINNFAIQLKIISNTPEKRSKILVAGGHIFVGEQLTLEANTLVAAKQQLETIINS